MANLQESPVWEEGIYQLEITDPVQGGPDGIDNLQAIQLAKRTQYLKEELSKKAPVDGVVPVANGGTGAGSVTGPNGAIHNLFPNDFSQVADIDFFLPALSSGFAQTGHLSFPTLRNRILSGMAPLNSPTFTGIPAVPAKENIIPTGLITPAMQTAMATEGQVSATRRRLTEETSFAVSRHIFLSNGETLEAMRNGSDGLERIRELLRIAHNRVERTNLEGAYIFVNSNIRRQLSFSRTLAHGLMPLGSNAIWLIIPSPNSQQGSLQVIRGNGQPIRASYNLNAPQVIMGSSPFLDRATLFSQLQRSFGLTLIPLTPTAEFLPDVPLVTTDGHMPNVFHFPGVGRVFFGSFLYGMSESDPGSPPDDLTVITFTDNELREKESPLPRQLKKSGVSFVNAGLRFQRDKDLYKEWRNFLKCKYLCEELPKVTTKYVLILDADDVAIQKFDGILNNFQKYNLPVLFGATLARFPDEEIDTVENRDSLGPFNYLNAGTCIGETKKVLEFYLLCCKAEPEEILLNRGEQHTVRQVFNKCQDWVGFDYLSRVFQLVGSRLQKWTNITHRRGKFKVEVEDTPPRHILDVGGLRPMTAREQLDAGQIKQAEYEQRMTEENDAALQSRIACLQTPEVIARAELDLIFAAERKAKLTALLAVKEQPGWPLEVKWPGEESEESEGNNEKD